MQSVIGIEDISTAIDKLLDKPTWMLKEMQFYRMLIKKLAKYRNVYILNHRSPINLNDLMLNIQQQPLYNKCRHQPYLQALVNSITVVEEKAGPNTYDLTLNLKGDIYYVVEFIQDNKYRVSFRNSDHHGYVAYLSPNGNKRHLPEYDKLQRILPKLDRVEIIHLATELIAYFNSAVAQTEIGIGYPISLVALAAQIC